jgi:hypothetical protein
MSPAHRAAPQRFGIAPATAPGAGQQFHTFAANQAYQPLSPPAGRLPFRLATAKVGLVPAAPQGVFSRRHPPPFSIGPRKDRPCPD